MGFKPTSLSGYNKALQPTAPASAELGRYIAKEQHEASEIHCSGRKASRESSW